MLQSTWLNKKWNLLKTTFFGITFNYKLMGHKSDIKRGIDDRWLTY